jgi:hypothetical protein
MINKCCPDGLFFDEFCCINTQVCSDLYMAVFDCIYSCVPCVKNAYGLKVNYYSMVESETGEKVIQNYKSLAKPILKKFLEKIEVEEELSCQHS